MRLTLAAAEDAAVDHGVREENVHRRRRRRRGTEMLDDPRRPFGVIALVLRGLLAHEVVGLHDVALGEKREKPDGGGAHFRLECEDPALGGASGLRQDADVGEPHQRLDGFEPPRVVVVSGDHHDPLARAGEVEERAIDDLLGLGPGGGAVEEVAGDENDVHLALAGDVRDLREHLPVLLGAALSSEGLPDVPVAGVEKAHPLGLC